ncbi:MAG: hypothetical protein R3C12_02605 [Planctomycetaceae bacterium]
MNWCCDLSLEISSLNEKEPFYAEFRECCLAGLPVVVRDPGLAKVSSAEENNENYELMRLFVDTFEEIDRNYVKDIDRRDLIEAAIQGMLSKLDPYSNYISPEDLASFEQDVQQEFGGSASRCISIPNAGN